MRASVLVAALAFACALPAGSAELGTLFHTPKEREQLERLRKGEKSSEGEAAIARPDPVITGYVKRSDGKSTVFIDKQAVPVRNPRLERRLEPKAVERYDPLPMPPPEPAEAPAPAKAAEAKPADPRPEAKARDAASPAPGSPKPPPRRRAEKDD